MPFIIAIDGPAGAGKGTLAQKIARHYDFSFLDTGALYRAVGRKAKDMHLDFSNEEALTKVALHLQPQDMGRSDLRGEEAGHLASQVAVHQGVRDALLQFQRNFATQEGIDGAILDGRDIGTVVLPHADLKIYVTASPEVRAQRRFEEMRDLHPGIQFTDILQDILDRDERDQNRAASPLKIAEDACVLDTSGLSIEGVFDCAQIIIDKALSERASQKASS